MFCGKCGQKIADNLTYCPYCGGETGVQSQKMQNSLNPNAQQLVPNQEQQPIVTSAQQQQQTSQWPQSQQVSQFAAQEPSEEAVPREEKKSKTGLFVTLGIIVFLIAALAAIWFANLFDVQGLILGKDEPIAEAAAATDGVESFENEISFDAYGRVNRYVRLTDTGAVTTEFDYTNEPLCSISACHYDANGQLIDSRQAELTVTYSYYDYSDYLEAAFTGDSVLSYRIFYNNGLTSVTETDFVTGNTIESYYNGTSDFLEYYKLHCVESVDVPKQTETTESEPSEEPTETESTQSEVTETELNTEIYTEEPSESIIRKVALVTDANGFDDMGYNALCWRGVEDWCSTNGVAYTYYASTEDSTDSYVAAVERAIGDGANVIVMPGWLSGATLVRVMDRYEDVYFISVEAGEGDLTLDYQTYHTPSDNAVCLLTAEEQAGYLAGYAAVREGYTKLGFLGGMQVPAIVRYGYGFIQGADAAAKEFDVHIEINHIYTDSFLPSAEITALMNRWYEDGTEIVMSCGGSLYVSAIEAANLHGGKVIGIDVDQGYIDACILTSAMKNLNLCVEAALSELQAGDWENCGGCFWRFSLHEGEYLGLPTENDSWRFVNFSLAEYEAVKLEIMNYDRVISDDIDSLPVISDYTTVFYN